MSRIGPIKSKRRTREEISTPSSIASPVKGWNTRDPLANMHGLYALTLDNWFPTTGTVDLRPGAIDWATGAASAIKTVMPWRGQASEKLFAVTNAGIYDVTTAGTIGASAQARTNGYCSYINFNTTGQAYLVVVNGADDLVYTNGSTWTSLASFSINGGGTLNTNTISSINSFKRSLFFIEKNSMNFYYLPIDQITGMVSKFPLGALFSRGGRLVAMGTWTLDAGLGPEDYSVFITNLGQAAVYAGTDPSDSTKWALKGIYDLAPPLGVKCFCKFGGDLLVLTRRGLFSLQRIMKEGRFDSSASLSDVIGEAFSTAAAIAPDTEGWEVLEYPDQNALICNIPSGTPGVFEQYIMNTKTNAWCRFRGWNAYSFVCFGTSLFAAVAGGKVGKVWYPGNDFGSSILAECRTAFNYYSPRSKLKSWKLLRFLMAVGGTRAVNVGLDTDYSFDDTYGAAIQTYGPLQRWDTALWDTATWGAVPAVSNEWLTIEAKESYCAAIRLRVIALDATISWSATDIVYEVGALL